MGRPKSKEEYRAELAETFANILEEKGLSWCKEWNVKGGGAPYNGVTKANYMDYKAGLITEKEYEKVCGAVMEVKQKSREMER